MKIAIGIEYFISLGSFVVKIYSEITIKTLISFFFIEISYFQIVSFVCKIFMLLVSDYCVFFAIVTLILMFSVSSYHLRYSAIIQCELIFVLDFLISLKCPYQLVILSVVYFKNIWVRFFLIKFQCCFGRYSLKNFSIYVILKVK